MTTDMVGTLAFDETSGRWEPLEPNPYAVGSIWFASWGYDQTNVDYLIVTRESAASVWLAPIAGFCFEGRLWPDPDRIGGPVTMHRKGRGSTYVRLDYVRHAWPYTGGGHYDTNAAGHIGH